MALDHNSIAHGARYDVSNRPRLIPAWNRFHNPLCAASSRPYPSFPVRYHYPASGIHHHFLLTRIL
jgi:hypothetical protein